MRAPRIVPPTPESVPEGTGVTIGKFYPPHLGHLHLITEAASHVDVLNVIVCHRRDQAVPGDVRAEWLADASPTNVVFHVTADDLPEEPIPWAQRTCEILGSTPDVAFTSEAYGEAWASAMSARHVVIDLDRAAVPTSGTQLREDLVGNFHMLVPAARAALARRVVLLGAESTGKTTLARLLAEHFGTAWVPEHGREYWEGRRYVAPPEWRSEEFIHIARMQRQSEEGLARTACSGLLFGDTDALATAVWHRRYLGYDEPELERSAATTTPDAYLLCDLDLPWSQDGTRESRDHREAMHAGFLRRLRALGVPWRLVSGIGDDRFEAARQAVVDLIEPVRL